MKYQNERFITLHSDASFEHRRGYAKHPAGVACFMAINETNGDTVKAVESAPLMDCPSNTIAEFLSIVWAVQNLLAKLAAWTPEYAAAQIDGAIIVIKNDCVPALNAARTLRLTGHLAETLHAALGVKPKAIVLKHVEAHKKVDNSASYANDLCDEHAKKAKDQSKALHNTRARSVKLAEAAKFLCERRADSGNPWALVSAPPVNFACTQSTPNWHPLSEHEQLCATSIGSDKFIEWFCEGDKSPFFSAVGQGGIYRSTNQPTRRGLR